MSYMQDHIWASQFNVADLTKSRVANPAEFPEPQTASKSYWIRNYAIEEESLWADQPVPLEVDVVIIGSGISGAAAVYRLSQSRPELRVALLDARGICSGATGRNGGHLNRAETYDIRALAKLFGAEDALRIRRLALRNRDMVLEAIRDMDGATAVDLRLNGSIGVFASAEERQEFESDLEWAKQQGYKPEGVVVGPEEVVSRIPMSSRMAQYGGAYLERSGTFYPRKFVALLLRTALMRMPNLTLHPFTPATSMIYSENDSSSKGYSTVTSKGTINSRAVLHATNGYAGHLLPEMREKDGVFGCRAHMFGFQPNVPTPEATLEKGVRFARCYHWLMQRPSNGPFLYGVADAEMVNMYNDTIPQETKGSGIHAKMADFLTSAFPGLFKGDLSAAAEYDWTGIMGFTLNGAAIVGRPSASRRGEFVTVGFNGEGMAKCFACATVATEALVNFLDGQDDWTPPEWFPRAWTRNCGPQLG